MRRSVVVLSFLVWMVVLSSAGAASAQTSGTISVCVSNSGLFRLVASDEVCKPHEQRLTWNITGPQGPMGPAGPAGPVGPVGPAGSIGTPYDATVDCTAGQSVVAAINQAGPGVAPVNIRVRGYCDEDLHIARSNTTLTAFAGGGGVRSVMIDGAKSVYLNGLTIQTGRITATHGAAFTANNLKALETDIAVLVEYGASGKLVQPQLSCRQVCVDVGPGGVVHVEGGSFAPVDPLSNGTGGARVSPGGTIQISRDGQGNSTVIDGMGLGLYVNTGGSAIVDGARIQNGTGYGIIASGTLALSDSVLTNNQRGGVAVEPGGALTMSGGEVSANKGAGIVLRGAAGRVGDGTSISGNTGHGLDVRGNSSVLLNGATITGNTADGINLGDISFMEASASLTTVSGNRGWGLKCAPPPAVARGKVYGSALAVSGNLAGQSSCDWFPVPSF